MSRRKRAPRSDGVEEARAHVAWLLEQAEKLEALANDGSTEDGARVSARTNAAKLRDQVQRHRVWLARREPEVTRLPNRQRALLLIASGRSTGEVAAELDVDRRTIQRWRADPEFDEQLRELQSAQTDALHALLMASQLEVARSLIAIATGPDGSDMAKVHAGRVLFEIAGRHKNAPVTPTEREGEIETEQEVMEALADIPAETLQKELARREAARAKRTRAL